MWLKFFIFLLIFDFARLKKLKLEKVICDVANEGIKNGEITNVAFISNKNDNSKIIRSEIHKCLRKGVVRFCMDFEKISERVFLPDSTLILLFADKINWVRIFLLLQVSFYI
jgi:hypothetical protein